MKAVLLGAQIFRGPEETHLSSAWRRLPQQGNEASFFLVCCKNGQMCNFLFDNDSQSVLCWRFKECKMLSVFVCHNDLCSQGIKLACQKKYGSETGQKREIIHASLVHEP